MYKKVETSVRNKFVVLGLAVLRDITINTMTVCSKNQLHIPGHFLAWTTTKRPHIGLGRTKKVFNNYNNINNTNDYKHNNK